MNYYIATVVLLTALAGHNAKLSCSFKDRQHKELTCDTNRFNKSHLLRAVRIPRSKEITSIHVVGSVISRIEIDALHGVPALRNLYLSGNKLKLLDIGVFNKSTELVYLDLSRNKLRRLPLGLFEHNRSLKWLDLKHNLLSEIDAGVFDPLRKLHSLNLMDNSLNGADLDTDLFVQNGEIETIRFTRNVMSGAPEHLLRSFHKLQYLALEFCDLSEIPGFVKRPNLITLKNLQLKGNPMFSIADPLTFTNLVNLNILDLSESFIQNISGDAFKPLTKLSYLNLRSNQLKTIPSGLFSTMAMLSHIDLSYNFLMFIPDNSFKGTKLKILNLTKNSLTYLERNFCTGLWNSGAQLEVFFFNHNPWQCGCLRDLLGEAKTLHIKYATHSYRGREPVCVASNDLTCNR